MSGCCSEKTSDSAEKESCADFPTENKSTCGDGDCHCPGCHVQVIPMTNSENKEFTPKVNPIEFIWVDAIGHHKEADIFHPPC